MIFETERLIVRKLILEDLHSFHEMQSNPKVMQYADGEVKTLQEHKTELKELINKYELKGNNFWIYAIERKSDTTFIGTVALVKDGEDDEIGYRFLEKYWGKGYGTEVCVGLVDYTKAMGLKKLIAYVIDINYSSVKILKKLNFIAIEKSNKCEEIKLPETKYELIL